MSNSVNWSDVIEEAKSGGGGFEPIPDGDYDLLITGATASLTQSEKPMYTIETTVQGGPSNGRKIWDRLIVSADNGRAMGFFFRKMKAIGLPIEFFQGQPTDEQITQALMHRTFRAKVVKSSYNGKDGNEIKEYYTATSGQPSYAGAAPTAPVQGGFPPPPAAAPQVAPAAAPPQFAAPAAPPVAPPAQSQIGVNAPSQIGQPPAPPAAPAYPAPPVAPAPAAESPWQAAGGQVPPPPPVF